mmetsp:Transcript_22036/g.28527  ORF Transcript_22036/g.28527 Transcript_22036/m.28527 type:complete len:125 (-) Transcript_22036:228-602(-)|eukprot:CAMPEP_0198144846 /NCGR_PEP_ID=MMETSP1443-20131203/18840_1 /TAXON_ID=186043 /ORGANISM="Entomoneis sp., Strain CCMP2396" /LENGTH=124 /DNA_ID=CAMNT_0043808321 /DNA_START=67 /DNA_END=441 /DNA_ORIENTATION=-
MMAFGRFSTTTFFVALVAAIAFARTNAFVVNKQPTAAARTSFDVDPTSSFPSCHTLLTTQQSSSVLSAKKQPSKEPFDREKQDWNLGLVLQYMTPWKNPNSIFVYMFGTLYVLGKISEARSQVP